jgi:glycosyltransferase involved in cell wall biosynthesis
MKIVHIITRLILGGAQENTLITCRLLAERGHDVTLITGPALGPEGDLYEQARCGGYKVEIVDELIRPIRPVTDLRAYFKVKKLLRDINPDIVHTHSAKAGIVGRFAASSVGGCGVVHGVHGLAFHEYQSRWLNAVYIAIERAAGRCTDYFVTVADTMTEKSLAVGIGGEEQYVTAYSAIDEGTFLQPKEAGEIAEFRRKHGIPSDAVVLVTVARLFDLKGHDFIIESAPRLAEKYEKAYWLFVGDGSLTETYKKRVAELGLEGRFIFAGLLRPGEVPLAIQASDILVHCSLREGLARALPQGMLCGKCVVSFDIDGAKEVVNERTGRLIAAEDVEGLVAACDELIGDAELRERLGAAGRSEVERKFAPATMVDVIEEVYRKLAGVGK